jgi:hypothetical protein
MPAIGIFLLVVPLRAMLAKTNSVIDVYIALDLAVIVILAVGIYRAFRVGFILGDTKLTVRQTFSTRSWPWEQVRNMEVLEQRARGMNGFTTYGGGGRFVSRQEQRTTDEIPVIRTVSRGSIPLRSMKARVTALTTDCWIDDVVKAVNERIEARGVGGGATPS